MGETWASERKRCSGKCNEKGTKGDNVTQPESKPQAGVAILQVILHTIKMFANTGPTSFLYTIEAVMGGALRWKATKVRRPAVAPITYDINTKKDQLFMNREHFSRIRTPHRQIVRRDQEGR